MTDQALVPRTYAEYEFLAATGAYDALAQTHLRKRWTWDACLQRQDAGQAAVYIAPILSRTAFLRHSRALRTGGGGSEVAAIVPPLLFEREWPPHASSVDSKGDVVAPVAASSATAAAATTTATSRDGNGNGNGDEDEDEDTEVAGLLAPTAAASAGAGVSDNRGLFRLEDVAMFVQMHLLDDFYAVGYNEVGPDALASATLQCEEVGSRRDARPLFTLARERDSKSFAFRVLEAQPVFTKYEWDTTFQQYPDMDDEHRAQLLSRPRRDISQVEHTLATYYLIGIHDGDVSNEGFTMLVHDTPVPTVVIGVPLPYHLDGAVQRIVSTAM